MMRDLLPILVLLLTVVVGSLAAQSQGTLIEVHPDGWCTVRMTVEVNDVVMEIPLLGNPTFLTVLDEEGLPLNYTIEGDKLLVDADAATALNISYETQSITSKEGVVWTLDIRSLNGTPVTVRLIGNPDVVGLSKIPLVIREDPSYLELTMEPPFSLDYVYTSPPTLGHRNDLVWYLMMAAVITTASSIYWLIRRRRAAGEEQEYNLDSTDLQIISSLLERSMRFSDLREELSLPKTTLWRRTRKLEERGLLKIDKKPSGNVLKLTKRGEKIAKRRT